MYIYMTYIYIYINISNNLLDEVHKKKSCRNFRWKYKTNILAQLSAFT